MTGRWAAATAGLLIISAALAGFLLRSHPVAVGTNKIAPNYGAVFAKGGVRECQPLARVPRGATRLRMGVAEVIGRRRDLRVQVIQPSGTTGWTVDDVEPGQIIVPLSSPTTASRHAKLCLTNLGGGQIAVSGENKRVLVGRGSNQRVEIRGLAGVVYLGPGSLTWLGRAGTTIERFANGQAGAAGGWAIWVAAALVLVAGGLAFWLVATRLEWPR